MDYNPDDQKSVDKNEPPNSLESLGFRLPSSFSSPNAILSPTLVSPSPTNFVGTPTPVGQFDPSQFGFSLSQMSTNETSMENVSLPKLDSHTSHDNLLDSHTSHDNLLNFLPNLVKTDHVPKTNTKQIVIPNLVETNDQMPNLKEINDQMSNLKGVNDQMPNLVESNEQMPNLKEANKQMPNLVEPNVQISNPDNTNDRIPNPDNTSDRIPNPKQTSDRISNPDNTSDRISNPDNTSDRISNPDNTSDRIPNPKQTSDQISTSDPIINQFDRLVCLLNENSKQELETENSDHLNWTTSTAVNLYYQLVELYGQPNMLNESKYGSAIWSHLENFHSIELRDEIGKSLFGGPLIVRKSVDLSRSCISKLTELNHSTWYESYSGVQAVETSSIDEAIVIFTITQMLNEDRISLIETIQLYHRFITDPKAIPLLQNYIFN